MRIKKYTGIIDKTLFTVQYVINIKLNPGAGRAPGAGAGLRA